MKINIWKSQKEIEKTYTAEAYDLMYGTLQDIFEVLDEVKDFENESQVLKIITENRKTLDSLLMDIFPEMTEEDLKHIKVKELIPVFAETFAFVLSTFSKKKN
jgi:predicted CopG family antitoxin